MFLPAADLHPAILAAPSLPPLSWLLLPTADLPTAPLSPYHLAYLTTAVGQVLHHIVVAMVAWMVHQTKLWEGALCTNLKHDSKSWHPVLRIISLAPMPFFGDPRIPAAPVEENKEDVSNQYARNSYQKRYEGNKQIHRYFIMSAIPASTCASSPPKNGGFVQLVLLLYFLFHDSC